MKITRIKFGFLTLAFAAITFTSCNSTNSGGDQTDQHDSTLQTQTHNSVIMPAGYNVGDEASDFELMSTSGQMVSLASVPATHGYIVVFTCNHCPYAKAYESRIMALDKKYKELGFPVVAISPNDPELVPEDGMEEMKKRAEEKGYTFPYLLDETQEIYPLYGATKTPHVFVLEKLDTANIVRYIGAVDNNYENEEDVTEHYVEDAVNALLKGEKVAVESTKAIGCGIKDKRKG